MEQVPDLKVGSSFSVTLLCSRFRFLPTSGFVDELSVSSEELAARSSADEAMPAGSGSRRGRLDVGMGRSNSTSTDGESSELEVGGVNMADAMLWEEPTMPVALPLATMGLLSGIDSAVEPNAGFLSRGRRFGRSAIMADSLLFVSTLLATDDRRVFFMLEPYCTLLLRGRLEDDEDATAGKGSSVSSAATGGGGGGELDLDLVGSGDREAVWGERLMDVEPKVGRVGVAAAGAAVGRVKREEGEAKELGAREGALGGAGVGYENIREFLNPSPNSCRVCGSKWSILSPWYIEGGVPKTVGVAVGDGHREAYCRDMYMQVAAG